MNVVCVLRKIETLTLEFPFFIGEHVGIVRLCSRTKYHGSSQHSALVYVRFQANQQNSISIGHLLCFRLNRHFSIKKEFCSIVIVESDKQFDKFTQPYFNKIKSQLDFIFIFLQ